MHSVIIGAGIAGLCLAIELRRLGVDVTVVERRYPGSGNSTRNVGRLRRMQLTADLTEFACRASDKWRRLDIITGGRNPLRYPTRYLWVLYGDDERRTVEPLQEMWQEYRANARLVEPKAVIKAVPVLDGGESPVGGVLGEAAIVHHDAAVHGLLLEARTRGIGLVIGDEVVEPLLDGSRAVGVVTATDKRLEADVVVNAAGGRSDQVARLFGVEVPNVPIRREVLVTEPSRPFMNAAVTFYRPQEGWFNQTLRGEMVAGVVDVDEPFGMVETSSLRFLGRTARVLIGKAPRLASLRVIRQWAGVYDTTPDRRPLIGEHRQRPGFYSLNGWSGRGLLLAPLAAELAAREIAGGGRDRLLQTFDPNRFEEGAEVSSSPDYYGGYAH